MGGWTGEGKDTIEWDGEIRAKKFKGDGSQLSNIPPGAETDPLSVHLNADNQAGWTPANVVITNLNSDLLDGSHAISFQAAGSYESANANIQTHVTGTGSPHTWAGINKATSSIADITTKSHTALTDIGINTHEQLDLHIANTGSGVHGLGTISTQNSNNVSITGGSITGITDLAVADGGTAKSSWTANGIVYASGTTTLTNGTGLVFDGTKQTISAVGAALMIEDVGWFDTTLKSTHPGNVGTFTIARGGDTIELLKINENGLFQFMVAGKPILCTTAAGNPAGVTNAAGIFAKDVASSAECFALDEAGNVLQISAHNPLTGKLYLMGYNVYSGKKQTIDIEALARAVETLTGKTFLIEEQLPDDELIEWDRETEPPAWLIPKKRK